MSFDPETILAACGPDGDPGEAVVAADWFLQQGNQEMAAAALDRAYGLNPDDEAVSAQRAAVLNELAIEEHGLHFRYVPAGTFLMGSDAGDPDERPVHAVRLPAFHVAEVPTTWAAYTQLMDWSSPPEGSPPTPDDLRNRPWEDRQPYFHLNERNKIRLQYCETSTDAAGDWHAHAPHVEWVRQGVAENSESLFGTPRGRYPGRPWEYDRKPMVAVSPEEAEELAQKLSSSEVTYALPTEAQWEKAARGGLIQAKYPWGDAPATPDRCDCDHFGVFYIRDPRTLPPNGYGLFGMSGGVWEWTADPYWALAYRAARHGDVARPAEFPERALRGGSWADCAHMVRVAARMSRPGGSWRTGEWSPADGPTFGFRLCRTVQRAGILYT